MSRIAQQLLRRQPTRHWRPRRRRASKTRFVIAFAMAAFTLFSYLGSKKYNPVTGEHQHIALTAHQEIAMGLRAAPQMIQQHGGLYPDQRLQDAVDNIGARILNRSKAAKTDWQFDFHLLRDSRTVNAFALPGGQIFITYALFSQLETKGQLAGVIGHEIGHVVARHSAQRIAKQNLTNGLIGSILVGSDGGHSTARMANMIGQMVNMKYGRADELQSDKLGVEFMTAAGFDPYAMIGVMKILAKASGGSQKSEFFSTHPNPENRVQRIKEAIQSLYPNGLPSGLEP